VKRALIVVVAIGLVVWVVSWFRNPDAVVASAGRAWPDGMGSLDSAEARVPQLKANEVSVKFRALANALTRTEAVDGFVSREIARGELAIGKPPLLPDVAAIRELLLGAPVVWESQKGIGGGDETEEQRKLVLTVARALIASALAKAHANDADAWDDLLAAWNLTRSLDGHPQMMSQTAALTTARMINAVAWKMPLPAPAWFAEVRERDNIRPLLESFQFQTASYARSGSNVFPTKILADDVDHDRRIAEEIVKTTHCDVNVRMNEVGTDLSFVWRRAFRYRAEREATANALRVRERKPIETRSRCSDGGWSFDGTTLRFTRAIATAPPDKPMPLVLRVAP
jgi:hypothetical protein